MCFFLEPFQPLRLISSLWISSLCATEHQTLSQVTVNYSLVPYLLISNL